MTESVRSWRCWGPYLLLMAIAFLAYANTFGNGWTYDDFPVIVDNPDVRSWAGFLKDSYPGRPLRELSYLLDHAVFDLNPFGWHIQQIFWHGLNACLVFVLGRRLQLVGWAALLSALIFLLHPLQVEVVANLSHRKDSLALAGSLGSILCYLRFLSADQRRPVWLLAALGCFALAMSAKQTAVLLPLVCLVYELLLVPRQKRLLARWPGLLAGAGVLALIVTGWWWQSIGGWQVMAASMQNTLSFKANYFEPVTLSVYYLTVLKSWVFMSLRLLWPLDLALEYTFPVATGLFDPWVLAGFGLLVVILATLVLGVRHWPVACWLLAAALCFFMPTSNLWPLTYLAADRYLYAPMAFLSLLAGYGFMCLPEARRLIIAPVSAVLLLFAALTWQQNRVWHSPQTLWEHAIKVSPASSFALNNMGNLALQAGGVDQAGEYYRRSVQVNPLNPTAHYNLGWLAERRGDLSSSLRHYRAFAKLDHPVFRAQLLALREHLLRSYGVTL